KHSLTLFFKVLFIFPSRYLFAIGLSPIFSLGHNLLPDWGCIPKQPDSPTAPCGATGSGHDGALTLSGAPFQGTWAPSVAEDASPNYNSDPKGRRFSWWALPGSLAITRGILGRSSPGTTEGTLDGPRAKLNHRVSWRLPPWTLIWASRQPGLAGGQCPPLDTLDDPFEGGVEGVRATMRDTQAYVPSGATCIQRLDGSRDSAIHTKYRISLRASSMQEPRYPLPRVVLDID
ncbi:Senescence-associated protein, partial [Quillaja saponaria]